MKINLILIIGLTSIALMSNLYAQEPTLEWVNQSGGSGGDVGNSITTDVNGNVLVVGEFEGTVDFDPGDGISNLVSNGERDIFVQKLDGAGNLLWVKQMGGSSYEEVWSISSDAIGNIYITGSFRGTADFDPNSETMMLTSNGFEDAFIQKLDSNGNLLWVNRIGGSGANDVGQSLTVDNNGDVIIIGNFMSTVDFDPGSEVMELTSNGNVDIFIQKLDSDGNLLWVNQIGGPAMDRGQSITTDPSGNIYICGTYSNTVEFNPGSDSVILNSNGNFDMFVQKLDTDGNFNWVRQIGGSFGEDVRSIACDNIGDVCITGFFYETVDFDPGPNETILTSNGNADIFVQKLKTTGDFSWVKQMGGTGGDFGSSIAIDEFNNILISGQFEDEVDFNPDSGITNFTSSGESDAFIQKLNDDGNLIWVKQMGGSLIDHAFSIAFDDENSIYTTGLFSGEADFDPNEEEIILSSNGYFDVFIQKLSQLAVGITENSFEDFIQIFPNPTKGVFDVTFEKIQEELNVRIMTVTGQLIETNIFQNTIQFQMELDQPAGVYFIEVTNEEGKKMVFSLVKE